MNPNKAKEYIPDPSYYTYSPRDAIIYALGIGANTQHDLHFLYEGHPDFQVFPTFVVAPGLMAQSGQSMDWPGIDFDLSKVLHGEQYIELHGQWPSDGATLRSETRVLDILDKGKAALIIKEVTTYDDRTGQKLAVQEFGIFQSGAGGFGAALYRQGSGDLNPLHIDPDFARMAGFPQPILHGLCSLGIATRLILRAFGANNGANVHSVKVRFSAPVVPGQTMVVEMWKDGDHRVLFQAKVKETGKVAISNGCIVLNEMVSPKALETGQQQTMTESPLKSDAVFKAMAKELVAQREALKGIQAILMYEIGTKGKPETTKYTIELKDGKGQVYEGEPRNGQKPTVTVNVADEDFVQLVGGQLDGTKTEDQERNDGKEGASAAAAAAGGGFFHGWFGPLLATLFGHSSKEESAEKADY